MFVAWPSVIVQWKFFDTGWNWIENENRKGDSRYLQVVPYVLPRYVTQRAFTVLTCFNCSLFFFLVQY